MIGVAAFYFISTGLITLGIASDIFEEDLHAPLVLMWAVAGLGLAAIKLLRDD